MPFGLAKVPAIFQILINDVLQNVIMCLFIWTFSSFLWFMKSKPPPQGLVRTAMPPQISLVCQSRGRQVPCYYSLLVPLTPGSKCNTFWSQTPCGLVCWSDSRVTQGFSKSTICYSNSFGGPPWRRTLATLLRPVPSAANTNQWIRLWQESFGPCLYVINRWTSVPYPVDRQG